MGSGNDAETLKILTTWRTTRLAFSGAPKGAALCAASLGGCCLPFGKQFFSLVSLLEPALVSLAILKFADSGSLSATAH